MARDQCEVAERTVLPLVGMLIVIRLLGFLAVATIGASLLAFLLTRNRRWLNFALQVLRFSVVAGLVLVLLYVLERAL